MAKILLVEDLANPRKALSILMKKNGLDADEAENGQAAIELLREQEYDLIVTDLKMRPVDGMQLLQVARQQPNPPEVIILTAFGSIENSVDAMRLGAFDYLTKPFKVDVLLNSVKNALAKKAQNFDLQNADEGFGEIIGNSEGINQVLWMTSQIANTNCTVLITGESGTGKELIARAIHEHSGRRNKLLVTINCVTLAETLLESELFGHVRGSFTGAVRDRKGLFQEADGGSIFLDEIGDITPQTQKKLCAFCRKAKSAASATTSRFGSMCGLSSPPTGIWKPKWKKAISVRISTTVSMSFPSTCRPCASARTTSPCWRTISSKNTPRRSAKNRRL
jgi:DNA-binding NtrC family response regulator